MSRTCRLMSRVRGGGAMAGGLRSFDENRGAVYWTMACGSRMTSVSPAGSWETTLQQSMHCSLLLSL